MKKCLKKTLLSLGLSVMTLGVSSLVGCSPVDDVKGWVDQIFCPHETKEIVEAVAPTCTEDGYTECEKCVDCGKEVTKGAKIEATGHTIEVMKGYAATCTTLGMTDKKACTVCEEVIEEAKIIPAKGHAYEYGVCKDCGATDGDVLESDYTYYIGECTEFEDDYIYIRPEEATVKVGDTFRMNVVSKNNSTITYGTFGQDEGILGVDERGNVTAYGVGTGYIQVEIPNHFYLVKITVEA